jgi:hypothetical protein
MQDQDDSLINSKLDRCSAAAAITVPAIVALVAVFFAASAASFPQPLSGRLHPASTPAAFAALALLSAGVALWRRDGATPVCPREQPATRRGMVAAVLAIAILALGTRSLGLPAAVFAAGAAAALGVRGVGVIRAALIGAGLSVLAALLFIVLLRQPLPLLPAR